MDVKSGIYVSAVTFFFIFGFVFMIYLTVPVHANSNNGHVL